MQTELKTALFGVMTMLAALSAAAEVAPPTVAHDPLINKIQSLELTQPGGNVTGFKRLGSGEAILSLADPLAPLKPAQGLVDKPVKMKARRKLRSREQLNKISAEKHGAGWSGR